MKWDKESAVWLRFGKSVTTSLLAVVILAFSCGKGGDSSSGGGTVNPPPPTVKTFTNPLKSTGPDPWVVAKDGYYYYTETQGDHISIWKTTAMSKLNSAAPVSVYTPPSGTDYSRDLWAPELHYLQGKWYIYFAADNNGNNPTHRMYVLENAAADPTTGTWTFKGKIADPAADKWAIDGTVLDYNSNLYFIWSGWQGDIDGEQDLFIAKMSDPMTLSSGRVKISSPTNSWERNGGPTYVNEGPEALKNGTKVFLTFSASGCWTDDYALGLLTLRDGGDPLNTADWTKSAGPVFSKNTSGGVYGPGHNSFFKSVDGTENWLIYHANLNSGQGCGGNRTPRMQKFTFNADGTPNFGTPVAAGSAVTVPSGE